MEFRFEGTKKILDLGTSWAISLPTKSLTEKGFRIGDLVKITVEPVNNQKTKEQILAELTNIIHIIHGS